MVNVFANAMVSWCYKAVIIVSRFGSQVICCRRNLLEFSSTVGEEVMDTDDEKR